MTLWRPLAREAFFGRSPIGLRLIDDFRGAPPLGAVAAVLAVDDGAGGFRATDIAPVLTPSSVVIFPDLGRSARPASAPVRHYRVTLRADYYLPLYTATSAPVGTPDGLEFDAPPWNDTTPPATSGLFVEVALLPAANYPFETHYPIVRGVVRDAAAAAVAGALVTRGGQERVLTDARGSFSLPLRWAHGVTTIDATDGVRTGSVAVDLGDPNQRDRNQTITIT